MQSDPPRQAQTLARFMHVSRLYFGLTQPQAALQQADKPRYRWRSLLLAGSLGALFGSPAFAAEASRQADPAKRNPNAQTTRHKADDPPIPAHRLPVVGKPR